MVSPIEYLKEVYQEVQRVVWPAPKTVLAHTGIVALSMIGLIALVSAIDYLFITIIKAI